MLAIAALPLDELPDARRARPPRAARVLRRRGRAREPDQRQVGRVPRRLRVLLAVEPLLAPTSTSTRFLELDEVLEAAHATRAAGATQFCIVVAVRGPSERMLTRVIEAVDAVHTRDRARGRVLARAPHRGAGAAARGRRREALQPQPRGAARAVPVDLYDPHLRRPRRHRPPRHRRGHGAVLRRDPRHGRDARAAGRLRVRARRARTVRGADQLPDSRPARRSATSACISPREALQAIALFRLVLPGAWLRLAGGREYVLGELQAMGLLAGANALIVGNYLTSTGRPPEEDHALLEALGMPVADGPGEGRFVVDADGAHARPAQPTRVGDPRPRRVAHARSARGLAAARCAGTPRGARAGRGRTGRRAPSTRRGR